MAGAWLITGAQGAGKSTIAELLDGRYRLSALTADEYARTGFVAIVQDNVYGEDVPRWIEQITARPLHVVVLRPRVDVVAARDDGRRAATGKVAYRGSFTPAINDELAASTPRHMGLWVDTSEQTPQESVDWILDHRHEAEVR